MKEDGISYMESIIFQLSGVVLFVLTTWLAGKLIRNKPSLAFKHKLIRGVHFCYWFLLVVPALIQAVYPGYSHLDQLLGVDSLPGGVPVVMVGAILFLFGLYYCASSSQLLVKIGRGAMAFKFSKQVVDNGVYKQLRNPMALGYYLILVGAGLIAHSTYFFSFNLLLVIPSHIFYIKYFEEFEVELRLGSSYLAYKKRTPFLIPRIFQKHTSPT